MTTSWLTGSPATTDPPACDVIEAEARRRMACLTKPRGFDGQRTRDAELATLDTLLDRWLELTH